jgi:hypothetical protein
MHEGGWGGKEQGKFQNNYRALRLFHTTTDGDPRTIFVAVGRTGVRWPIYRTILLVPAVLTQPIPIIIGAGCIKTVDIKNVDLWCQPR